MNINNWLIENSEEKYRLFSNNLVKTSYPLLGIRVPVLRTKAKEIAKEEGLKGLEQLNDDYFESVMLQGFIIAYSKEKFFEKEKYIYEYLLKCDNWSNIDSFAMTFKTNKADKEQCWQFINSLKNDENDSVIRYVLVTMLANFLQEGKIDAIIEYSRSLQNRSKLIEMANGWLLASAYINYPEKVLAIVNDLDLATYRYTKGKIHDSYRVSKEDKQRFDEVIYNGNC